MKTDAEDDEAQEMRDGMSEGEHVSKEDADYGPGKPFKHCSLCEYFERGNKCKIVEGEVDPYAWCKYFEKPDSPRDMAHLKKASKAMKPESKEMPDAA